jgi:hypothetical protein
MVLTIQTRKYGIKEFIIDDEDYDKVKNYKWGVNKDHDKDIFYVISPVKNQSKDIKLHRLIMDCPPDKIIDHINHNPLDNRKCNLRICTRAENNKNSQKRKDGFTSKYKGVSLRSDSGKYAAQISHKSKTHHIGLYTSEKDAALAYNEAAIKYHGEFALLNEVAP